jgi:MoaA/NifB/PqqE/SkfB family radical SAM enzyme
VRPKNYNYVEIVREHLGGSFDPVFNGEMIYPRQLEVHLPSDRKKACNFHCSYCQGGELDQSLGSWEEKGLRLMDKLQGAIPLYVYGGAYTEPLMNEFFLPYLEMTKKYNNNFGCHSNGSLLTELEDSIGFCSRLIELGTDEIDYFSCSLDAGTVESHKKTKNISDNYFTRIIEGLRLLVKIRGNKQVPKIRVCYLMNKINSSKDEIANIVKIMKDIGVDSLRFSIPYMVYGRDFEEVERYRNRNEIPFGLKCEETVKPYLSKNQEELPYIFWHGPGWQDVKKMNFNQCIYSYYQITYAADGYVYKCSSTASPSFSDNRLGEITDDLEEFQRMVLANHKEDFDAKTCFVKGARCNRIALEINDLWNKGSLKSPVNI